LNVLQLLAVAALKGEAKPMAIDAARANANPARMRLPFMKTPPFKETKTWDEITLSAPVPLAYRRVTACFGKTGGPMARAPATRQEPRRRILQAALELVAGGGYEALQVRAISERAGVSSRTI